MTDRTLPVCLRLVLQFTGLLQVTLGVTLLLVPSGIDGLWPWPWTHITALLLGASTLMGVPVFILAALAAGSLMPPVMLISYRVLQVRGGALCRPVAHAPAWLGGDNPLAIGGTARVLLRRRAQI